MGSACAQYCTDIAANCTDAMQQYGDEASCLGTCAAFPDGMAGDTMGNSLGCRAYHTGAAAGDPAVHCGHAGPSGGATCGTTCEAYCTIVQFACTGANEVYADEAACLDACTTANGGITDDVPYTSAVTAGDNLSCRIYHATVAATSTDLAAMHCAHVAAVATDPANFPCQ